MKICSKCKFPRDELEFNKRSSSKDGLNHHCQECSREMVRSAYWKRPDYYRKKVTQSKQRISDFIRQIKEATPCKDCGKIYAFYLMDFDHRDDNKKFDVAHGRNKGFNQVKEEIAKCDVVCCMCHRIRTHNRKCLGGDNRIMPRFERGE